MKTLKLKPTSTSQVKTGVASILPVKIATSIKPTPTTKLAITPGTLQNSTSTESTTTQNSSSTSSVTTTTVSGTSTASTQSGMANALAGTSGIKANLNASPLKPVTIVPKLGDTLLYSAPDDSNNLSISGTFTANESFDGIVNEKPLLISVIDFKQLYDNNIASNTSGISSYDRAGNSQTPAGILVDITYQSKILRDDTLTKALLSAVKNNLNLGNAIQSLVNTNKTSLSQIKTFMSFVSDIMKKIGYAKSSLDLRSTMYNTKINSDFNIDVIDIDGGITDILHEYGYSPINIREYWSGSKIWLQTIKELSDSLKQHSSQLVSSNVVKKSADKNTYDIFFDNIPKVSFTSTVYNTPISYTEIVDGLISTNSLAAFVETKLNLVLGKITSVLQNSYKSLPSSPTTQIAAIFNLITSEVRWSTLLKSETFLKMLSTEYGYSPNLGAEKCGFFSQIFGVPQSNVFQIYPGGSKTLTTYGQFTSDNSAILRFENGYIKSSNSVYTPGSVYYFDKIFKFSDVDYFDIARLNTSWKISEQVRTNLLKFFSYTALSDTLSDESDIKEIAKILNVDSNSVHNILRSSSAFMNIVKFFINTTNFYNMNTSTGDPLTLLFVASNKSLRLRALLFIAVLYRGTVVISGNDAAGLVYLLQNIAKKIVAELNTIASGLGVQFTTESGKGSTLESSIINALTSGTPWFDGFARTFVKDYCASYANITATSTSTVGTIYTVTHTLSSDVISTIDSGKLCNSGIGVITQSLLIFDVICKLSEKISGVRLLGVETTANSGRQYIVERLYTSHKTYFDQIYNLLTAEEKLLTRTAQQLISIVTTQRNVFKNIVATLTTPAAAASYKYITGIITDRDELQNLFSDQQMYNVASTIDDISLMFNEADPEVGYKSLSGNEFTDDTLQIMKDVFSRPEFSTSAASNKKIMSIGLPGGFTASLQSLINSKSGISINSKRLDRQSDIIRINVHKKDLRNPGTIYKPISYLFELSRYPLRVGSQYTSSQSGYTDITSLFSDVKTRDYSTGGGVIETLDNAFNSETYSFLQPVEKDELRKNHAFSFICEMYIKLLTGLDISETTFLYKPEKIEKNLADKTVIVDTHNTLSSLLVNLGQNASVTSKPQIKIFPSVVNSTASVGSPVIVSSGNPKKSTAPTLTSEKQMNSVTNSYSLLSSITSQPSTISDPATLSERLVSPKRFDRVFHIFVDPDDFQIDNSSSKKSNINSNGVSQSSVLSQIQTLQNFSQIIANTPVKETGDIVFEQYFITIETYDGEIV